ncbi:hypothetical protein HanXRQr2_Chr16g0766261 [Helianthus annuus]|uniref:Uncharacterized protein n=1 Tax=Helianthus annuus TaxID=4232 RepID=A0A9K3DTW6_HELAN|nr:hypothetical protein HanXRQr2_Chr16g0766261 [Helianthus annuus]
MFKKIGYRISEISENFRNHYPNPNPKIRIIRISDIRKFGYPNFRIIRIRIIG